jgi:hypothetical protein
MTKVIIFPLRLRSPPNGRVRSTTSATAVVPFPYSRRRNLVEQHARAMRALPDADAEAYLTRVLEQLCSDLEAIGIDCDDCQNDAIHEFAEAIGRKLHGPQFRLEPEEAVQ